MAIEFPIEERRYKSIPTLPRIQAALVLQNSGNFVSQKKSHAVKLVGRKKIICLPSDKLALRARLSSFHSTTRDNIKDGLY